MYSSASSCRIPESFSLFCAGLHRSPQGKRPTTKAKAKKGELCSPAACHLAILILKSHPGNVWTRRDNWSPGPFFKNGPSAIQENWGSSLSFTITEQLLSTHFPSLNVFLSWFFSCLMGTLQKSNFFYLYVTIRLAFLLFPWKIVFHCAGLLTVSVTGSGVTQETDLQEYPWGRSCIRYLWAFLWGCSGSAEMGRPTLKEGSSIPWVRYWTA